MPGELAAPYRPPCYYSGTWPDSSRRNILLGGCQQHWRELDKVAAKCNDFDTRYTPEAPADEATCEGSGGYWREGNCYHPGVTATAEANIADGAVTTIDIVEAGTCYDISPTVTISGGGGTGATAQAIATNGEVITIEVLEGGSGYTTEPTVTLSPPVRDNRKCEKVGWKGVRAIKMWHGMPGFDGCLTECDTRTTRYRQKAVSIEWDATQTWTIQTRDVPPVIDTQETNSSSYYHHRTYNVGKDTGTITEVSGDCISEEINGIGGQASFGSHSVFLPDGNAIENLRGISANCGKFVVSLPGMFSDFNGLTAAEAETWIEDNWADYYGLIDWSVTLDTANQLISISITADFDWLDYYSTSYDLSRVGTATLTFTKQLSEPYTLAQCMSDASLLANEWNLSDDVQYPWRDDPDNGTLPLVARDEAPATSPDTWQLCDYEFTVYTGNIRGIPLPHGTGAHFAFDIPRYSGGVFVGNGEWCPDFVPAAATWWTYGAMRNTTNFPPSGWLMLDEGGVVVQKWAAIKPAAKSANFFRPCGADKLQLDTSDARWLATYGVTYCSRTDEPLLYVWDGRDAEHPSAWSICGRLAVASIDGDAKTVTLSSPATYLESGDTVDFTTYDTSFVETVTAEEYTVDTVAVDKLSFTYTDEITPEGDYIKSHGAPHYKWHDDNPKGDFTFCISETDGCTSTVDTTCEAGCIRLASCEPPVAAVVCGTYPEDFASMHAWLLPAEPTHQGGLRYIVTSQFTENDPLWTEQNPCEVGETAPLIESRCEPPAGSPGFPTGLGYYACGGWV